MLPNSQRSEYHFRAGSGPFIHSVWPKASGCEATQLVPYPWRNQRWQADVPICLQACQHCHSKAATKVAARTWGIPGEINMDELGAACSKRAHAGICDCLAPADVDTCEQGAVLTQRIQSEVRDSQDPIQAEATQHGEPLNK